MNERERESKSKDSRNRIRKMRSVTHRKQTKEYSWSLEKKTEYYEWTYIGC